VADSPPIGVFDSGIGGLSILAEIRRQLPHENCVYVADQAHVPYGPRSLEQVAQFSLEITRFLMGQGCKLIVVACNTASAAALTRLRAELPGLPFVGMEPAVKPAALETRSGHIGVLATSATFQGQLFASVVERFAEGLQVHQATAPGLVEQIEAGDLDGARTRDLITEALRPMLAHGIDTLVLACTHYPFVIPVLESVAGPGVKVIDPAPAVARQTARLLEVHKLQAPASATGRVEYVTTLATARLADQAERLIGQTGPQTLAEWRPDGSLSVSA
jgi:glutamate racemase